MAILSVRVALIAAILAGILHAEVSQWTNVGPEGGSVGWLAVDPQNPANVYALTCAGDVFKTRNGGASWSAMAGFPAIGCNPNSLVVDPVNAGTLYAMTCRDIFKSTDGGASWNLIASLKLRASLQTLAIGNQGTLFATRSIMSSLDHGEIIRSSDGGLTWTQATDGAVLMAVDPQDENTLYGNTAGGLFKTTDGGVNWTPANSGLPTAAFLVIDPRNSDTLYAGTGNRIFKSTDGGANWSAASFGLPPDAGFVQMRSLAINPQNPNIVYTVINRLTGSPTMSSYDFFLSTSRDGAASWTTSRDPLLASADLMAIIPDPQNAGTLYLGTSSGMLKTTDGGAHWNFSNSGLRAASVGQVVIDSQAAGTMFVLDSSIVWHSNGLFKSTDGGTSWSVANAGLPVGLGRVVGLATGPHDVQALYVVAPHYPYGQGLFKSEDAGGSWAEVWHPTSSALEVGPVAVDPRSPNIVYAGVSTCYYACDSRVYKSVDAGRTWIHPPVTMTKLGVISAIAFDPQNSGILYAGTINPGGDGGDGLFKSLDGGSTWQNLTGSDVWSLAIDPRNPDTIYYGDDGGWLKSTDAGQTWNGLKVPCNSYTGVLAIDPGDSGTLYCGDDAKVFRSTDAGTSWVQLGSGLVGRVHSLTFDPHDPAKLYAGAGGGLFAIRLDAPQQ